MRKKKRNGWLEKGEADASAEDEAEAKRQRHRQPPIIPPAMTELNESIKTHSIILNNPPRSMPSLPSVQLEMTSLLEESSFEVSEQETLSLPPAISELREPVKIALPPSASLNNPPESMPQPPSHPLMANLNASQQSTPEPDELAIYVYHLLQVLKVLLNLCLSHCFHLKLSHQIFPSWLILMHENEVLWLERNGLIK